MRMVIFLAGAVVLLLSGCWMPRDPEGTTERVRGGTLHLGVLGTVLSDAEERAVAAVADALDAEVSRDTADPHRLFAMLGAGEIDIVVGGVPEDTPFASRVGLTRSIGKVRVGDRLEDRVLAIRQGENRFLMTVNRTLAGLELGS